MKNKLIIKVFLPASAEMYEMKVSKNLTVRTVTEMLIEYIKGKNEGAFIPTSETILCYGDTGLEIEPSLLIGNLDLCSGKELILI